MRRVLPLPLRLGPGRRRPRLRDRLLRARDRGLADAAAGLYVPIYRKPTDLVRCTRPTARTGRGRVDADRRLRPLLSPAPRSRTGRSPGAGLELAWAADPVELFFLQIQGSGRVRLPDGSVMRIGYAGQNGREYVAHRPAASRSRHPSAGRCQHAGIKDWIRANPDQGRESSPWLGVFLPARAPGDVVGALSAAMQAASQSAAMKESLAKFASQATFQTPAQFVETIKEDLKRWGPVVKASGFVAVD